MARNRAVKIRAVPSAPPAPIPFVASVSPADVLNHILKLHNRLLAPFSIHLEKRHKISLNEFRLLMSIGRLGSAASHEVAELTGVNSMAISRAVAVLRRQRRLEVTTDQSNRRRKTLRLTAAGRALYQQMLPTTEKVARYLFEALRPDEILAFDRFVRTVTEKLEAYDEAGRSLFLERTRPDGGLEQP
jgi:MarR family transcriptional regulator, lower aerobic nicotinate degradation pathway regulator